MMYRIKIFTRIKNKVKSCFTVTLEIQFVSLVIQFVTLVVQFLTLVKQLPCK